MNLNILEKLKLEELDKKDLESNTGKFKNEENQLIQEATLIKLKVENQKEKQRRIQKMIQDELQRKQDELDSEKERFEREKRDSEEQQREYEKKIQLKYLEIDERKKQLSENETYLLKKVQNLDNKYETVKRETEALKYKMEQLDEERVKFEDKAYLAQQTSVKVFEESEYVAVHKKEYEDDRAELEKLRYELEAEKAHVRAEHLKLEHKRTEILMRERMIDQLKLNKVQEDLESQQRMNQSAKPYYYQSNEPFSAAKSNSDMFKSHNLENFSPNKLKYPSTIKKQDDIASEKDEKPLPSTQNLTKSAKAEAKHDPDTQNLYSKLSESIPYSKKEEAKEAFDFNSYDQDDDDSGEDEYE